MIAGGSQTNVMNGIQRAVLRLAGLVLALSTAAVVSASVVGKTGLFDGGVIAYVNECSFVVEGLYQLDVSHRIRHQLTDQHERIFSMSYSPNGRWLVFEAMERDAQLAFNRRIYAIDLETSRQYLLAPEYVTFETPLLWEPDGEHLKLRMLSIGTTIAVADLVVNVANGEVTETSPIPMTTVERNGQVFLMPPPGIEIPDNQANRVDADISADGYAVRSRLQNGMFDLYIDVPNNAVRLTHDTCVERYPRWRPN